MKLFSKETPVTKPKSNSEVITKVHEDFEAAGEKLYQEAIETIQSIKIINEDKIKRLDALGFKIVGEVVAAKKLLATRELSEKMMETITYYRETYPLHKFITEDQLKKICKKYSLIYSTVDIYKGFVPEKNLREMESLSVKEEDLIHYIWYTGGAWGGTEVLLDKTSWMAYEEARKSVAVLPRLNVSTTTPHIYPRKTMVIAAPRESFVITGKDKIKDFKLAVKPVPDPVVLMPVNEGYLIVTAWGE